MRKISPTQQIFSEIELFLEAGKYEDAKVLLSFIDHDPLDRESRLYLLLIHMKLDGPSRYRAEIERLRTLPAPNELEKEIIEKIFLLDSNPLEKQSPSGRALPRPVNPPQIQPTVLRTIDSERREDTEDRDQQAVELAALKMQIGELKASKEEVLRSLEKSEQRIAELQWAKEAALGALEIRFRATVRSLEDRLTETASMLERRDADLQEAKAEVNQLSARLDELEQVKEEVGHLLREELEQKSRHLQLKDATIKNLEEEFGAQIRVLESQLGDKQKLLASRDAEIATLLARVSELIGERTELATATSLRDAVAGVHGHPEPVPEPMKSSDAVDDNDAMTWLTQLRRAWQMTWKPLTFAENSVPLALAVLLIIPIAYLLPSDGRTLPDSRKASAAPPTQASDFEPSASPISPARRLLNRSTSKTAVAGARNANKRETPPRPLGSSYRTRRAVPLRAAPGFSAGTASQIDAGTSVRVLDAEGDWVKVKTQTSGNVGYLRKEYLVSVPR